MASPVLNTTLSKPQVHVAMLGARMHYAVPKLLHAMGMLGRFYTDAYIGNKPRLEWLLRNIPGALKIKAINRWSGRKDEYLPADRVLSFDRLAFQTWWRMRWIRNSLDASRHHVRINRAFDEWVIRHGLADADVIYGVNRASLELFQYAKDSGISCILEQCSAPRRVERQLMAEEMERWPDLEPGLVLPPRNDAMIKREEAEWTLADRIIAPSEFVVNGLQACGIAPDQCRVVPYGIALDPYKSARRDRSHTTGKLRILYAGRVSLLKGAPYLLEALRLIGSEHIEARFAGQVLLDHHRLLDYKPWVEFLGLVPRTQMVRLFQWADILLMPSICEGSAIVIYEALAAGLPVIATGNCGAMVRHGIDGYLVPIRDVETLAETISSILKNRDILTTFNDGIKEAWNNISLEAYKIRLEQELCDFNAVSH